MIVNIAPGINQNKHKITQEQNLCYARICMYDILRVKLLPYIKRTVSSLQRTTG